MESDVGKQEGIKKYLLGMLSQEQQPYIEERILTDDSLFEELLIAEDELIDQYLSGELSEAERKNFERHFLVTPERQQKVRFASALKKYVAVSGAARTPDTASAVTPAPPEKWSLLRLLRDRTPAAAFSLAIVVLLSTVGLSLVLIMNRPRPLKPPNSPIVVLTPSLARDETGEIKKITVSADVDTVQLRLVMTASEYQSYRVVLQSRAGAEVLVRDNLIISTDGRESYLALDIPAGILRHDDYQVKVSGHLTEDKYEDVNRYSFRVVK